MIVLNLFLISVIWVVILDISGFMTYFKAFLGRILKISPNLAQNLELKPIDCSFCMTWWSGLLYLILIHRVSFLYLTITLLFSFFTTSTKDFLYLVKDIIDWVINKIGRKLL